MVRDKTKKTTTSYRRVIVLGFVKIPLLAAIVFLTAGRVTYWQGWLFIGFNIVVHAGIVVLSVKDTAFTELLRERFRPGPGIKRWDRAFLAVFLPASVVIFITACLDAGRFGWSKPLPVSVYSISYCVLTLSSIVLLWAMWTNRFFSSVVRIQTDRGHEVVRNGPYRFVRHPGYAAGIFLGASIPLVLGSVWALIPYGVVVLILLIRTRLEDAVLCNELPGYADYARHVRYRLFPGIW